MRADRPLLLILAALTAGCADPEPFVYQPVQYSPQINKQPNAVLRGSTMMVCYSGETPWAEVEAVAREQCGAYGLLARTVMIERWQCRATSPHQATFSCYDPEMIGANGEPINPFNPRAVAEWERRTGKTAKPHNFMTTPGGPGINPAAAPTPAATDPALATPASATPASAAPASAAPALATPAQIDAPLPARPLTPADIADRPPFQPPQPEPRRPATPGGGAYPADGFTLPQGSWGDAFQD